MSQPTFDSLLKRNDALEIEILHLKDQIDNLKERLEEYERAAEAIRTFVRLGGAS